jgi:two-component system sensor histidine kinase/response regulator
MRSNWPKIWSKHAPCSPQLIGKTALFNLNSCMRIASLLNMEHSLRLSGRFSIRNQKPMVNVLLVEDDVICQKMTSRLLAKCGLDVTIANDGVEALQLIQKKHFTLILMDLQMPHMDGCETTLRIRALDDPRFKTIPIIAFTASTELKEKVAASGMNDLLSKPLHSEELLTMINHYVV